MVMPGVKIHAHTSICLWLECLQEYCREDPQCYSYVVSRGWTQNEGRSNAFKAAQELDRVLERVGRILDGQGTISSGTGPTELPANQARNAVADDWETLHVIWMTNHLPSPKTDMELCFFRLHQQLVRRFKWVDWMLFSTCVDDRLLCHWKAILRARIVPHVSLSTLASLLKERLCWQGSLELPLELDFGNLKRYANSRAKISSAKLADLLCSKTCAGFRLYVAGNDLSETHTTMTFPQDAVLVVQKRLPIQSVPWHLLSSTSTLYLVSDCGVGNRVLQEFLGEEREFFLLCRWRFSCHEQSLPEAFMLVLPFKSVLSDLSDKTLHFPVAFFDGTLVEDLNIHFPLLSPSLPSSFEVQASPEIIYLQQLGFLTKLKAKLKEKQEEERRRNAIKAARSYRAKQKPISHSLSSDTFSVSSDQDSIPNPFMTDLSCSLVSSTNLMPTAPDNISDANKKRLKRCLLLSLKRLGLHLSHPEFVNFWKPLYIGSSFALRNEMSSQILDDADFFSVIEANMNFLQLKNHPSSDLLQHSGE